MSNIAVVIPAAKAPLEVKEVEVYTPGPHEFLVKNEVISFIPVEAKIAKLALIPIPYPAILGLSYGGTVEATGPEVTNFEVGDKVAVQKRFSQVGPQYGAYQRYVVAGDDTASKVPAGVDLVDAATLISNLTTIVGLFGVRLGLNRPKVDGTAAPVGKKVLIYGGSSSVGSLAVQWVSQAGYDVVTTTSPKHKSFVSKLGAVHVIDHTQEPGALVKDLKASGPYDYVVDTISLPQTVAMNAQVVAAQGGGKVYATLPPFGPETLPEGVIREFASWPEVLREEDKTGLEKWTYETYFPQALAKGRLLPQPVEKVSGGLTKGVNDALDKLHKGVSGVKLVVDPWE
ncbi:hypothetical protein A1O1_07327 [Capronia coronata CBS 617.96]|uniref:Enoyl reductase (ER) domain-containing protein n=1 Tax=Capronia coronata CBS 617.96 TaxID=1182541 RepID=W9XTZ1_9EURO|nr:uncharacterized protein A1O1_07327 [Capronia coronata CBS 617.96]EXJ83703.1 hypothetical protein A1O1_07327 [Capronia coronata CBS 617.96]